MKRVLVILMGVLMIIGGIFCLITPIQTFLTSGYMLGVLILCDAIGNIVAWFHVKKYVQISGWYLVSAILSLIFGIMVIANITMQFAVDMAIVYIVAAWVITVGISRISLAVRLKQVVNVLPKAFDNKRWLAILVLGILMVVFGVLCMFKPIIMSFTLGTLIAWFIIFTGASLITIGTYLKVE